MKKVKVWADTYSIGLFDETGEFFLKEETTISDASWKELQQWVKSYDYIIPLGIKEREKMCNSIDSLDAEGKRLLLEISREWKHDILTGQPLKFVYYSEGLMRYLD